VQKGNLRSIDPLWEKSAFVDGASVDLVAFSIGKNVGFRGVGQFIPWCVAVLVSLYPSDGGFQRKVPAEALDALQDVVVCFQEIKD